VTNEHEFEPLSQRCVHCGTTSVHHARVAQPCVPQWGKEALRPEPARREYAVEDAATISARIAEFRAERDMILNAPAKDEAI